MDEVELVDKVRILHVALLWAMNNYFPWHHNEEPPFSEKDRHALVLFIQNDAFTFTRCNAETIKSYLQSDFHLYGLSRSALMGYSDSLKSVITADQLNRHTDNPYLFEFPEKETPFVKEFFDCRAALNWVESLREKPQQGADMGKLLFTEDELYSNRPYKDVEDWERQKAEAIKQCRYNNSALKWLSTAFFDWQKEQTATVGDIEHAVTIMDAFRWYASYQRRQFSENQTYEAREFLREAQRGESVCELISFHPQNIKAILCDYAVIQVAEKALKCWNDILPYHTGTDQQEAEPVEGALESHKKMSFEDYCFEQIKMMELNEQKKFVFETRQGDGLSCGYGLKWMNTYNQLLSESNKKEIKTFKSPLSRAKERFRKLSVD